MIITGVIGVLLFTNVLTLYLYIKNDIVQQNNIRTYVSNEEGYRKQLEILQNSIVDHKQIIRNLKNQLEENYQEAVNDFFNNSNKEDK